MELFAGCSFDGGPEDGLAYGFFPALVSFPVFRGADMGSLHFTFEHVADELGNRGVFVGGLPLGPAEDFLFDSDGHTP